VSVIDAAFLVIGLVTAASVLVGVGILYRINVLTQSYLRAFATFASPDGDQPSQLALLWDSMVDRAVSKVSMGQLGRTSGEARREKSAEVELVKASLASEQPVIAMALDKLFPKWGKMLVDNPGIMPQMMEILNKKMAGPDPGQTNGKVVQQRFQL